MTSASASAGSPSGPQHLFTQEPDLECLSPQEKIQLESMSERRREQFSLGRTALRTLAGRILGMSASEVPILVSSSGAPILGRGTHFLSLSHSGDGALAVVAPTPVGCDLEAPPRRHRDVLALAERFFHPSEREIIEETPDDLRQILLLRLWTRKEAAFKCGAVDWPRSLLHPWHEGENTLASGTVSISTPIGLPEGWTGSIALWDRLLRPDPAPNPEVCSVSDHRR